MSGCKHPHGFVDGKCPRCGFLEHRDEVRRVVVAVKWAGTGPRPDEYADYEVLNSSTYTYQRGGKRKMKTAPYENRVIDLKLVVAQALRDEIARQGITQTRAAEIVQAKSTNVSAMMNASFGRQGYSLELLLSWAIRLGLDVELNVTGKE